MCLSRIPGRREAAGRLLHLPGDVGQVLLHPAAPQRPGGLLHGPEPVGGGRGRAAGGPGQSESRTSTRPVGRGGRGPTEAGERHRRKMNRRRFFQSLNFGKIHFERFFGK